MDIVILDHLILAKVLHENNKNNYIIAYFLKHILTIFLQIK